MEGKSVQKGKIRGDNLTKYVKKSTLIVIIRGLHGLACRGGNGRSARHHSLYDLVWTVIAKADIPALKEPLGLLRTDGKQPDGVTLMPWKQGKCVTWDVTVSDTLAQSYVHETSKTPGAAAEAAAESKTNKYSSQRLSSFFVPIAAETTGNHQQGRDGLFVRTWKAHHTMHRPSRERLPHSANCLGYLRPHTRRTKCSRSSNNNNKNNNNKIIIMHIVVERHKVVTSEGPFRKYGKQKSSV